MPERPIQKVLRTGTPILRRKDGSQAPARNGHDLLMLAKSAGYEGALVCVSPSPGQSGRWSYSPAWTVYIPGVKTDPNQIHHGYHKRFIFGRDDKTQMLAEALSWTAEHYDVQGDWDYVMLFRVRHYFPARLLDAVDALVTQRLAAAS